jgi:ribosome-binding factor A
VLDRQRTSVAAKGGRYVGNVTDVSMSGDTASATVTYYFERNRDDKTDVRTALVREDGAWRSARPDPADPG